jgi:hypothetical protein
MPAHPVTLTPEQVEALSIKLADLRHSINNHLSLIVAAVELIQRKPEMAVRLAASVLAQPEKISQEIRLFSQDLQKALEIGPG